MHPGRSLAGSMARSQVRVLVVDVGGTNVKMLVSGEREWRRFPSGPSLTASGMVSRVKRATADWEYDVISLGYPGPVVFGHVIGDPPNLARGWIDFDFPRAFARPVNVVNDAALPALGSYKGGSMLFIGLGTGVGAVLVIDGIMASPTLDHLEYLRENRYGDYLAKKSLRELGRAAWERHVHEAMKRLKAFFGVDYIVLGGGNIDQLERVPKGAVLTNQDAAFAGGRLLWDGRRPVPAEVALLHWKKSGVERGGPERQPLERLLQVPVRHA
jgi:polyphosphate glucokinase